MSVSRCVLVLVLAASLVQGRRCPARVMVKQADVYEVRTLLSPGYPKPYEMQENCTWQIEPRETGYAIQLTTVDMDLNDIKGECRGDYLEIYEGDDLSDMSMLATWCGDVTNSLQSRRRYVQLHFVSDGHYAGRGFAVDYGLVRPANMACSGSPSTAILVDKVPVVDLFQASDRSCKWKVSSMVPDTNLVFEIFKPAELSCDDGKFVFSEGGRTFEYCSSERPFSKFFFSNDTVTVDYVPARGGDRKVVGVTLRMYTKPTHSNCDDASSYPAIEVGDSPVMFSLPYMRNNTKSRSAMSPACPVKLQTKDSSMDLRLDLMGIGQQRARCNMEAMLTVTDTMANKEVLASCHRGNNPVYLGQSRMLVRTLDKKKMFLRASSMIPECNARTGRRTLTAEPQRVGELALPEGQDYINLSKCSALITAYSVGHKVLVTLKWEVPRQTSDHSSNKRCQGDFVKVFDGVSTVHREIFSTCDMAAGTLVHHEVVSSGRSLLVKLDADHVGEGPPVQISYYSIPRMCRGRKAIMVNSSRMNVSSFNYPRALPMNENCYYDLVAANPNDTLVVKVVRADLGPSCGAILTISGGADLSSPARVCGQETGTWRVSGGRAVLHSQVVKGQGHAAPGGWRLEVHTEEGVGGGGITIGSGVIIPLLLLLLTTLL